MRGRTTSNQVRGRLYKRIIASSAGPNLRNLRIQYLRLMRRGGTDLIMQNKANFHWGAVAITADPENGYVERACVV